MVCTSAGVVVVCTSAGFKNKNINYDYISSSLINFMLTILLFPCSMMIYVCFDAMFECRIILFSRTCKRISLTA